MVFLWILAVFVAWTKDVQSVDFLVYWVFMTFFSLFGGFSTLMTLWNHPEIQREHPALRRQLLGLMAVGVLLFWGGIFAYVGSN